MLQAVIEHFHRRLHARSLELCAPPTSDLIVLGCNALPGALLRKLEIQHWVVAVGHVHQADPRRARGTKSNSCGSEPGQIIQTNHPADQGNRHRELNHAPAVAFADTVRNHVFHPANPAGPPFRSEFVLKPAELDDVFVPVERTAGPIGKPGMKGEWVGVEREAPMDARYHPWVLQALRGSAVR